MMSYGDPSRYINRLHVEESCLDLVYTKEIIERSGLPVAVVKMVNRLKSKGSFQKASLGASDTYF